MELMPIFYSFRRCPYAIRARLALAISETGVELREILLRDKPQELLNASAKASVPVLVLPNGTVLDQSLAIMEWALKIDSQGWLYPDDKCSQQHARHIIAECDGSFKKALDRCKYPERHLADETDQAWKMAIGWLTLLEQRLTRHESLCSDHDGLADIAIFPFVRQFAAIDPARWQSQPLPNLISWLERWLVSPLFGSVMDKYPRWQSGDVPTRVFGHSLRAHV